MINGLYEFKLSGIILRKKTIMPYKCKIIINGINKFNGVLFL
jgi:hypothetical protein